MTLFEKWLDSLLTQPSLVLEQSFQVEGFCKKHLGPRLEYAVIELSVEPSDVFTLEFSKNLLDLDEDSKELLDSAIYGVLDIIITTKSLPLKNIKLTFLHADIHPIDSNRAAFRKAGRDAGQKIMANLA